MTDKTYRAMLVEESGDGKFVRRVTERSVDDLPEGEVLVCVSYSSLNYKDALSATGNRGVTRNFPHTPGIDAAGVVEMSATEEFRPGDKVIVTSYDLGMNTPGGFGQYIRVPAAWVVGLPEGLSLRESMAYGTAGFTAALSVYMLREHGVAPGRGEILVTGATGGVGGFAVAILSGMGHDVVAVTGKSDQRPYLLDLGAREVISREEAVDRSDKPLLPERWAGVVDTVGGDLLETAVRRAMLHSAVTCCGNVASAELNTTVYPFILRGISLIGISSQHCPMPVRREIWRLLGGDWKVDGLHRLTREVSLDELDPEIELILRGGQRGRVVVDLKGEKGRGEK
ncbi:MAG: YhdH/YhfP family quinone oxidoreductase [bacterium]|nr:MAG: YhdH/YhfP family quinone oxidoreductase [bacterium]